MTVTCILITLGCALGDSLHGCPSGRYDSWQDFIPPVHVVNQRDSTVGHLEAASGHLFSCFVLEVRVKFSSHSLVNFPPEVQFHKWAKEWMPFETVASLHAFVRVLQIHESFWARLNLFMKWFQSLLFVCASKSTSDAGATCGSHLIGTAWVGVYASPLHVRVFLSALGMENQDEQFVFPEKKST